jgi:hypothetical protein
MMPSAAFCEQAVEEDDSCKPFDVINVNSPARSVRSASAGYLRILLQNVRPCVILTALGKTRFALNSR